MSLKSVYRAMENISGFIDIFGYGEGNTFSLCLTYKKYRFDKEKCAKSWNVLRTYINKKSVRKRFGIPLNSVFHYCDVWEEDNKGGHHLHFICYLEGVKMKRLRKLLHHFKAVTGTNVGFSQVKWTYGKDCNGIKFYMCKYLTKQGLKKTEGRSMNFSRKWDRRVKGAFSWVNGMSSVWRKVCRELKLNFSRTFDFFHRNASYSKKCALVDAWTHGRYLEASALLNEYFARCFMFPLFEDDLREFGRYWCSHQSPMLEPESRAGEAITCIVVPLPLASRS